MAHLATSSAADGGEGDGGYDKGYVGGVDRDGAGADDGEAGGQAITGYTAGGGEQGDGGYGGDGGVKV